MTEFMRLEEVAVANEIEALKCDITLTTSTFELLDDDILLAYLLKVWKNINIFCLHTNLLRNMHSQIPKYFPPLNKMDRFWMERKDNRAELIQGIIVNILLNDTLHITVDKKPLLNVPYTIILDDS